MIAHMVKPIPIGITTIPHHDPWRYVEEKSRLPNASKAKSLILDAWLSAPLVGLHDLLREVGL
jgi:hypothetical protein